MRALYTRVRIGVVIGVLLVSLGTAAAQSPDGGYRSFKPDGAGPHPAVVFVSGCSGFAPSFAPGVYERVAEQLRGQGYMVAFADYLGRWNLKNCAGGSITHADAAKELVKAATWLKSQPSIDPKRIAALGWSYGGGAVLVALDRYTDEQRGFSRAVVYYPDCRSVRPWTTATPVLMLLGAEDDVAPGKPCEASAKKSAAPEAVKIVWYPGAYHAFDVSELPPKTRGPWGTMGYQAEAARAAWEEVQQFLKPTH
jgi:dienelactone hydrolase